MEKNSRVFIKSFGSGYSKVEIDLKDIPTELLLEEINERLESKLEVQGLALLMTRMGLDPETVERKYQDRKDWLEVLEKNNKVNKRSKERNFYNF